MSKILHLGKLAMERGTYPISIPVKDSYELTVNPGNLSNILWWLTEVSGKVINNRAAVSKTSENPLVFVLSDEDLQITDRESPINTRILTIRGEYNSTYGSGLPFTYAVSFDIVNLAVVDIDLDVIAFDHISVWDVS